MRQVIIYPGVDNWVASCPSLPGCLSRGETREQAIATSKEAVDIYVNTLGKDGLPVPAERFEACKARKAEKRRASRLWCHTAWGGILPGPGAPATYSPSCLIPFSLFCDIGTICSFFFSTNFI